MGTEVIVKKWGNSMGVILPRDFVDKMDIRENQKILIELVKEADFTDVFGSLKLGMSGQEMKDLARKGWEK